MKFLKNVLPAFALGLALLFSCSKDEGTRTIVEKDTVFIEVRDTVFIELPGIEVEETFVVDIEENPEIGSELLTIAATTDSEKPLSYRFIGNSTGFIIDSETGIITIDDYAYPFFDYETDTTNKVDGYLLTVEVSNGDLIKNVEVQVDLTDVTIIWDGPDITFTKADSADWTLQENQDRITDDLWLTRANNRGLFNIKVEDQAEVECNSTSPYKSLWARNLSELTLEHIQNVEFQLFVEYHNCYPLGILDQPSILMIPEEDIFISVTMTSWTSSSSGGGFSYTRSTPTQE